jgi:hypothetical protein
MKQIKIKALFSLMVLSGLASCLKEDRMNIDTSQGPKNVVEFANTGSNLASAAKSTYPRYNIDLGTVANNATVEFNVNVSYSGVDVAPQDITVNLALDPDALAQFNTENSTSYVAPPTAIYTFPTSVVIAKGTHQSTVKVAITVNSDYDFGKQYAIPIKIASASMGLISGNFGKAIYSFGARNYLDGDYSMKITTTGWGAYGIESGIERTWPSKIGLATFGATSVTINNYHRGGDHLQPAFAAGNSATAFGAATPIFLFDATNKLSNVLNMDPDDGRGRAFEMNPAVTDSRYDAATKTIYGSYFLKQTGRPNMLIDVVFTYIGPRP